MIKVRVDPDLLADVLFPGTTVKIVGARFDMQNNWVLLGVQGPSVDHLQSEFARATVYQTLGPEEPRKILETTFEAAT